MKHVVFYSGGICSYFTAKRVIEKFGKENVILLFTDTLIEDDDLYRFIDETTKKLGATFVSIADGRTPFEVYKDSKFLGNNRIAPCSHILKQATAKKWILENCDPQDTILYLGLDWTETHRFASPRKNWNPYQVEYPMSEKPYMTKADMLDELKAENIKAPRLYEMGFAHNNCGGFCCRAGQGHFARLLEKLPKKFEEAEKQEEFMRQYLDKDVAFMKKTVKGVARPYTLRQLRKDIANKCEVDLFDIGGCGCFVDDVDDKEVKNE